jgi:predicted flap endonuclease-1-like 5' DNA nuclease
MMTNRNRFLSVFIFTQIVVLFGVLVWLWIRRFSQEGVVVWAPRFEIDLTPKNPVVKAHPELPDPAQIHQSQQLQAHSPHSEKPAPARRQAVRQDDLKRIEGIGPVIASTLQGAGINTYKQLARAKAEFLKSILDEAGIPIADPTTWPEQAAFAAAGDWVGLAELKRNLK